MFPEGGRGKSAHVDCDNHYAHNLMFRVSIYLIFTEGVVVLTVAVQQERHML